MTRRDKFEGMLRTLRTAHPLVPFIFMFGACFELWKLCRIFFPDAEPFYDDVEGHAYILFQGRFYDINGEADNQETIDRLVPMRKSPKLCKEAFKWHRQSKARKQQEFDAAFYILQRARGDFCDYVPASGAKRSWVEYAGDVCPKCGNPLLVLVEKERPNALYFEDDRVRCLECDIHLCIETDGSGSAWVSQIEEEETA